MSVQFGQSGFEPEVEKEKLEKNGDYGDMPGAPSYRRSTLASLRKSIGSREPGHETKDPFAGGGDIGEGDEEEIDYKTLKWWYVLPHVLKPMNEVHWLTDNTS